MFKKRKELRDKYEEGTNTEQQRDDETVLAFSSLQIFFGKFATPVVTSPSTNDNVKFYVAGLETVGMFIAMLCPPSLTSIVSVDNIRNGIIYPCDGSVSVSSGEGSGRDRQDCGLRPTSDIQ